VASWPSVVIGIAMSMATRDMNRPSRYAPGRTDAAPRQSPTYWRTSGRPAAAASEIHEGKPGVTPVNQSAPASSRIR